MLGLVLAGMGLWQGTVVLKNQIEIQQHYAFARAEADSLGKPLLVVGGPGGTFIWQIMGIPHHGCGDACLDISLRACSLCGAEVMKIEGDVRSLPFSNKEFGAAFASHVLEHLPTPEDALQAFSELQRVADNVHVVSPSRQSLMAWLHPDHHLWVQQHGDVLIVTPMGGGRLFA